MHSNTPSFHRIAKPEEVLEEAEDLAYLLNNNQEKEETNEDFNESLFTIIDEMEEEDSKHCSKQANEFFTQDRFE